MKRLKVLLSAYSCEPGRGSEPGVGWSIVREIAKYHDVWVLTRPDESKDAIESELRQHPMPSLKFVYFTLPFWQDSRRLGHAGGMQMHYYLWQIQAYFVARRLHQEIGFDIAHHVTFVKYSTPSFLAFLPIPLIWGPLGGGESAPKDFWKDFSLKAKLYELARDLARWFGERDPFVPITARRSAVVQATTEETAQRLYRLGAKNVGIMQVSSLLMEDIEVLRQFPIMTDAQVKFISMGRLLHWKGFHLGIRAFAAANLPDAEYWICGEGPEQEALASLAESLGVSHQVKFLGLLPRQEALHRLGQCHVLVHPSLHDSGGWVCAEAMAAGRPVICLDMGGPAVQISSETGIKVSALNPETAVEGLAKAMVCLAKQEEFRVSLGQTGRQVVQETRNWSFTGQQLMHLYETALADTTRIP